MNIFHHDFFYTLFCDPQPFVLFELFQEIKTLFLITI